MKRYLALTLGTLAALGVVSLLAQTPAPLTPAQTTAPAGGSANADTAKGGAKGRGRGPAVPAGPTPHLPDGKVDLSGVWNGGGPVGDLAAGMPLVPCNTPGAVPQAAGRGGAQAAPTCREPVPLSETGKKVMASRQSKDDPEANCLPTGIPRQAPYPWRLVQTPTHIFFLFEGNIHSFRQIFMNGKHPADPDPTWYGHSTGTWDGDTLVVDTVGFNDKFWFDFRGHPHTEQLHTLERYTRTDMATMNVATTITDPGAYTKPFTVTFAARLRPNEELMEYICQENQQDAQHLIGAAGLP
jgi:hypothetical protein